MDGARPRPIDAIAVMVAAGLTAATGYQGLVLALLMAPALSLLWMRRAPLTVAWISAGTALALPVLLVFAGPAVVPPVGAPLWPPTAAFAAYGAMAFARNRPNDRLRDGASRPGDRHPAGAQWLPVIVLALAVLALPHQMPLVLRTEAVIALAVMYGMYTALRTRLQRGQAERAERIERERLAGEMHDVVTYRVSRMVLQAGMLAMSAPDERVRAAAEELRATGCEALDELRHMVALLRRASGEGFDLGLPLPDLRPLITESACAGVPVELAVTGTPAPVPGVVGRVAYLLVQEALTNVRKHAPGADVRVQVSYRPGAVRLSVRNTPGRPDAWVALSDPGMGLLDLCRHVELAGGTMEIGQDVDGGFRVEASFPTSRP
ncbi:sensor histidine kinase [Nonomuraea diastatica]|uniref:histidine kinase n=1 Tax=Nonomuraea diastatica TaxID=1848329 RepID=A0A4V2YED5_9ACTN|nr:histidine kinase [Nonomuraea diastatica]TDD18856.1 two-component sensor histidine kinase [Nonomuraea diastatica]